MLLPSTLSRKRSYRNRHLILSVYTLEWYGILVSYHNSKPILKFVNCVILDSLVRATQIERGLLSMEHASYVVIVKDGLCFL